MHQSLRFILWKLAIEEKWKSGLKYDFTMILHMDDDSCYECEWMNKVLDFDFMKHFMSNIDNRATATRRW